MNRRISKTIFHLCLVGLAASPAAALQIGAWVGSASDTSKESISGYYPQPTKANVDAFIQLQGRKVEYVEYYAIWPATWSTVKSYADVAYNAGATLFVTWQPNGYTAPDINSGKADAYITKFANDMKGYSHEVWLRPLHEANGGDWYSWAVGNSSMANTDENVAQAFQHIVTLFKNAGVTNVKWVWTTNGQNMTTGNPTSFDGTYPGDDYCDYISIDAYNFGTFHTVAVDGWASTWQTFVQTIKPAYTALAGINKPIFVAEFSSSEKGGDKAKWYKDAFASLATTFPRIFALMIFNNNDANGDWRVNTSAASLQAWKECVAQYASTSGVQSKFSSTATGLRATTKGVSFVLQQASPTRLEVRTLDGKTVESRNLGRLPTGSHEVSLSPSARTTLVRMVTTDGTETLLRGANF
ncbi:MAG: glycosyl hydrolase [Fibrobacterota bacterium]